MATPRPGFDQVTVDLCHGLVCRVVAQPDRYWLQRWPGDIAESDNGKVSQLTGMLAEQAHEENLMADLDQLAAQISHGREFIATPVSVVLIYKLIKWHCGYSAFRRSQPALGGDIGFIGDVPVVRICRDINI